MTTNEERYWSAEELASLLQRGGFRLRGEEMTRLEMFSDAAFAFAMTMQVVAAEKIPRTFAELTLALKGAPAFAASFTLIMLFWAGHRRWSRRYGLEDAVSVMLSLALVFVILVYIYPLRLMASVLLNYMSGGALPSELEIRSGDDLAGLFIVFGVGYAALATILALLHRRALALREPLALDRAEVAMARFEVVEWGVGALVGLASAAMAAFAPGQLRYFAGFVYMVLPIVMPLLGVRRGRVVEELLAERSEPVEPDARLEADLLPEPAETS